MIRLIKTYLTAVGLMGTGYYGSSLTGETGITTAFYGGFIALLVAGGVAAVGLLILWIKDKFVW